MITLEIIKKTVEGVYNQTFINKIEDISVRSRKRPLPGLRYTYFNLCRYFLEELNYPSLELIGSTVDRDHASVLHGLKEFDALYGNNTFVGSKIYFKCITRLSKYTTPEAIKEDEEKDNIIKNLQAEIEDLTINNIDKISEVKRRLNFFSDNELVNRIISLEPEDLQELEVKLDAFFKVKESFKKSA